jgi:DNA-binding NtrC family response regulator
METSRILLLDLHPVSNLRDQLRGILDQTFKVEIHSRSSDAAVCSPNGHDCDFSSAISVRKPELIFAILPPDLRQPDVLFQTIGKAGAGAPLIIVVEEAKPFKAFELVKLGAADYITPPLKAVDILPRIWRLLERARQPETFTQKLKEKLGLKQLIGKSQAFLVELEKIPLVAKCDASILISGETGTGKELYVRAIHYLSPRADKPFISVNCGAIPADLLENELFGHERGAFTGATNSQSGLLQEAEGGTLFLDEIDCLPLLAQSKLLRFLQEKEYRQLGSSKMRKADVRVIAASNANFEEVVTSGKLRRDLYYRLNVIRLVLPPLRERREDIPLLLQHFLEKYAREFSREVPKITPEILQTLMLYDWPGNVRELEHIIERAIILSENGVISSAEINLLDGGGTRTQETFQQAKANIIKQFERTYIQRLLQANQGNITRAAQAARKNRRAFWQLIRKHQIDVQRFKQQTS